MGYPRIVRRGPCAHDPGDNTERERTKFATDATGSMFGHSAITVLVENVSIATNPHLKLDKFSLTANLHLAPIGISTPVNYIKEVGRSG